MKSRRIIQSFIMLFVILFAPLILGGCGGGGGGGGGSDSEVIIEDTDNPPEISQVNSSVFSDNDNVYPTGRVVRIDVEESSGEGDIVSGTIQITSASQGYNSGVQPLTFGSIYYNWDTTGLNPASDYVAKVTLTDSAGQSTTDNLALITLAPNPPAINKLVSEVDINVPAVGLPVRVVRTYLLDSGFDSSLGFGWTQTYLMHVVELSDRLVKVFNSDGSGAFFKPNAGGGYNPPIGSFRTLTKNTDGTFKLKEKFGTLFNFDVAGRLTSIKDRNGNTVTLSYDANGLLKTVTDSSGQNTTFNYDTNNRIASITDPAGRSVSYGYDSAGDLISVINISGLQTAYTYDTEHNLTTITDPTGRQTFFSTNTDDLLESVSDAGGVNAISYQYAVPAQDKMTITDALGNQTVWTYDNNGSVTSITDPLGNITVRTYDNNLNLISETDANGGVTTFTYDLQDNVLTTTNAQGTTTMTYEPLFNQVASLTDAKENTTTFSYDAFGNLIVITYPDGATETFSYNTSGNLISKTDRMSQTINFGYDTKGKLTNKSFPDGTSDSFTYHGAGNLTSATDENGTISFSYDTSDRVTQVAYPGGEVVSYAYDGANNRIQTTCPDGRVLNYSYDQVNRLTQIDNSGQMVASYSYDQMSRVIWRDLQNGTFTTFTYDQSSRLLDLINSKSTSEIISSFSYTYDNLGNRLTMTTLAGMTQYTYDAINQLTQVVLPDGSTTTYNLDPAGNRNSMNDNGMITNYTTNNLNQYTDVEGDTYTYDANRNMTSKTTASEVTTYTYDFENRLIQVDTPAETITYTYDPFGRRTSKTTSYSTTNYIYDDKRIIMEKDDSGIPQATYIYGIGVDEMLVMNRGGVDYYYMQDGLGSVTDLSDFSENIIESFSYDAYGTPSNQSSVGNPYLYTGREFEPETGLYFYRARYYNPEIGRFTTTDPIGFAGGNNLYTYVSNNPINFADPSGLSGGPPGLNSCTLLNWECETFYCNPLYILVGGPTDCMFCRLEVRKKCGTKKRGDPTFIQASQRQVKQRLNRNSLSEHDGLVAKISIPCEDSLVRGNVPIFGLAHGNNFKEYRVECGEGIEPSEWVTVASSTTPQTKDETISYLDDSNDLTIYGNLATWDTGLKNYVYLPSHPKDHPINLKGTYTVRLVVTGKDGSTVKDRFTVEVANVIPNAWGGKVISKDNRVVLSVPEQSVMDDFRLILIKQAANAPGIPSSGRNLIGNVYEVREPSERFTKDAVLKMVFIEEKIGETNRDKLGIYGFNSKTKEWEYLDSRRAEDGNTFFARVQELHSYYAIMTSDLSGEGSTIEPTDHESTQTQKVSAVRSNGHNLIKDTFEEGLDEWSNRDGEVGADVSLDGTVTFDGTQALKITNMNGGGNFAVNARATSFDAREYSVIQFDYRIPREVKTNFLVKVSGRWYEIGFTDDQKELGNKRVNIAHIGDIEGVVADDKWHTSRFNLYELLRTKTGNTIVEEMIMADWDVGGYMKLQFGQNPKGATYYIDNFNISREVSAGLRIDSETILVDNFNQKKETNTLGGSTATFYNTIENSLETSFVDEDAIGKGHSLKLSYNVSEAGSYTGYITTLQNLDLRGYQTLSFFIKGVEDGQDEFVGLRDVLGHESKVLVNHYLLESITTSWQEVNIPLAAFSSIKDWGRIENLSFSFNNMLHDKGVVFIDNVAFNKEMRSFMVHNFEETNDSNLLGRKHWTFVRGNAAINGKYAKGSPNGIYRITYGGNIGDINAYASDLKSFAGWATQLGGVDCSQCGALSFRIRGAEGGENASIYLDDGNFRWGVEIAKYANVTTSWQNVTIPISEFEEYGVDLTHLAELKIVFEGVKMSGTIYVDDIQFGAQDQVR